MNKFKIVLLIATLGILPCIQACHATAHQESTGQYIDNSAITAKVKAALIADDDVKARNIHIESYKGNVQLSGYVDSIAESAKASAITSNVPGVTSVHNNLIVK